jgi:hypothetical protein
LELGAWSWELGAGSWELGAGSWELGAGSWKLGADGEGAQLVIIHHLDAQISAALPVICFSEDDGQLTADV